MFPIDKRLVNVVVFPAPDAVPEILQAIDEVPMAKWNSTSDLTELAAIMAPYLEKHGARRWDFVWTMERHFSEPYGPLPKATQTFMAGIPDMFLQDEGGLPETGSPYKVDGVLGEQSGLNLVKQTDVEVLARPYQYEAADRDRMPEEYLHWLEKLCFAHGECMMPYFGDDAGKHWNRNMFASADHYMLVHAPDAETRLRANNFMSEEFKHTYQFFHIYHELNAELPIQIYLRERDVFRAYESMKVERTFSDFAINQMMGDRFGVYQGFEWVQSSYSPLARVALKVCKDERGHSNYGYLNVRRLIESDPEQRKNIAQRIRDYWYPYFMAAFGGDGSKNNREWRRWGLKQHTNHQLREAYHAEMVRVFDSLGIEPPDVAAALGRGQELMAAAGGGRSS